MKRTIVLDAGPLGILCAPSSKPSVLEGLDWLSAHLNAGSRVIIPEIADYEVRRELLRANKSASLKRLDDLESMMDYLPITTASMRKAAELWALARQTGQPTAGDKTIDADIILVAQTQLLTDPNAMIGTTNVGHLIRFAPAQFWLSITV
jgi:predicted nucleic acid-binding protein